MILTINFINENLDKVPSAEHDSFIAKWKVWQEEIEETRRGNYMSSANGSFNEVRQHIKSKLTALFKYNIVSEVFIDTICGLDEVYGVEYWSLSTNFDKFMIQFFDDFYLRQYLDKNYIELFEGIMNEKRNQIISLYS